MSSGPRTALRYLMSGRPDALEDRIEFFLIDPKAEVLDRKRSVVVDEVEGQPVVDVYGRERAGAGIRPAHAKELRETPGRSALISRRYDDVVELYRHVRTGEMSVISVLRLESRLGLDKMADENVGNDIDADATEHCRQQIEGDRYFGDEDRIIGD